MAQPCEGDACFCKDKTVSVIVNTAGEKGPISGPFYEVRDEFQAATGATLEIVEVPFAEHFPKLMTDMTTGTGQYDTSIAGAWWLGDLVGGDYIIPYDEYYDDTTGKYPKWDITDVQTGPQNLLSYDGKKYMVANDHDGQVMYYRRDLFEDPAHQAAFKEKYGYDLKVPDTWQEFRDAAEYFDGKDLNGDGTPDDGLTMHLKVGGQGMFHFMSFAAPFVIGPDNPNSFWFDPATMKPLMDSPGHMKAMETLIDLVQFGPEAMMGWSLGEAWDHFLRGEAAMTFTWGDLGALAQQEGSAVKGKTGSAPMPGTTEYYDVNFRRMEADGRPQQGRQHHRRLLGRRHLQVLRCARMHLLLVGADGHQGKVHRLCLPRLGRRRPGPHQPLPAAQRHQQHRRLRGRRLGRQGRRGVHQRLLRQLRRRAAVPVSAHSRHLRILDSAGHPPV